MAQGKIPKELVETLSQGTYANETALYAGQGNQESGNHYTVTSYQNIGEVKVKYLGTTVGDRTDYSGWPIYVSVITLEGDNEILTLPGDEYDKTIKKITIKTVGNVGSLASYTATIDGGNAATGTIAAGDRYSRDVSITVTDWNAFEDLQVIIPNNGTNTVIEIEYTYDGTVTPAPPIALITPSLNSLGITSATSLTANWTDNNTSPNESSFLLQHASEVTFASPTEISGIAADSVSQLISGLTTDVARFVRVRAIGNGTTTSNSPWSVTLSAIPTASIGIEQQGTMTNFEAIDINYSPLSGNHTLVSGSNRLVVVMIAAENSGATLTGVTYGGVAMTMAVRGPDTVDKAEIWYILEANLPADGVNSVALTWDQTTGEHCMVYVKQYQNVSQAAPEDTDTANEEPIADGNIATTVTPTSGALVVSVCEENNRVASTAYTPDDDETELWSQLSQNGAGCSGHGAHVLGAVAGVTTYTTLCNTTGRITKVTASFAKL